jgi:hypothetical protein
LNLVVRIPGRFLGCEGPLLAVRVDLSPAGQRLLLRDRRPLDEHRRY